jgi:hypothetical protein
LSPLGDGGVLSGRTGESPRPLAGDDAGESGTLEDGGEF